MMKKTLSTLSPYEFISHINSGKNKMPDSTNILAILQFMQTLWPGNYRLIYEYERDKMTGNLAFKFDDASTETEFKLRWL